MQQNKKRTEIILSPFLHINLLSGCFNRAFPSERQDKDQHGVELQTACQHIKNANDLGEDGKRAVVGRRAKLAQTGAYVVDTGKGSGEGFFKAKIGIKR